MEALYIQLLESLVAAHDKNHIIYLCWLARRIDKTLLDDLQIRLSKLEETDQDLYEVSLCDQRHTPPTMVKRGNAFWVETDFESRYKFISRIIIRDKK